MHPLDPAYELLSAVVEPDVYINIACSVQQLQQSTLLSLSPDAASRLKFRCRSFETNQMRTVFARVWRPGGLLLRLQSCCAEHATQQPTDCRTIEYSPLLAEPQDTLSMLSSHRVPQLSKAILSNRQS
eukprot:TRINITY_DN61499_c0_g1_i3.p2 TRINITY_DN61499_c0_g1~~TRINITY_DN61499_c0_g1_i3.p2  ORF type:complete len:128 (-),score=5.92 TRINITY_DN61499_c0_g1_i3:505-888(-)